MLWSWGPWLFIGALVLTVMTVALLSDARFMLRWTIPLDQFRKQGEWEAFERYLRLRRTTWRPFVLLVRWFYSPGIHESKIALELSQLGYHDEALTLVSGALERTGRNTKRVAAVLSARALVLYQAARFEEALELRDALRASLPRARHGYAVVGLCLTELGRPDEAERFFRQLLLDDASNDSAQIGLAGALRWLGRFDESVQVLQALQAKAAEPVLPPDRVKTFQSSEEGRAFLSRLEARRSGMLNPGRQLACAEALMCAGRARAALPFLEQAGTQARSTKLIRVLELRIGAWASAAVGSPQDADAKLEEMWRLVHAHPAWRTRHEAWLYQGIVDSVLRRFEPSLRALSESRVHANSPLARAWVGWWTLQTQRGAGLVSEAGKTERTLAESGVRAWFVPHS